MNRRLALQVMLSLLVLVGAAAVTSPVRAAPIITIYAGSDCQLDPPGHLPPPDTRYWFPGNGFYGFNPGGTNVLVVCPILRNVHVISDPGNGFLAGEGLMPQPMRVHKPSGTHFKCYYQAMGLYAGAGYVWNSGIPQQSGNSPIYMPGLTVTSTNNTAHYALLCDVPPGGRIYSYMIAEHQW